MTAIYPLVMDTSKQLYSILENCSNFTKNLLFLPFHREVGTCCVTFVCSVRPVSLCLCVPLTMQAVKHETCRLVIAASSKLQAIPDHPANAIHSPNAELMLACLLRCRPNINPASVQYIMFDCQPLFPANTKHLYTICTTLAQYHRRWFNIV